MAKAAFAALLALAAACSVQAGSWPNMTVAQMSDWFWGPFAARLPAKDFIDAVQAAQLRVYDSQGHERKISILSITSEFSFQGDGMWQLFLQSLANITFAHRDGRQDHLAAHLVATVMTLPNGTADSCTRASQPYGARCVPMTCPMFTHENYGYKTPPFYALSFAKTLTILDALTLGMDVFFLDGDQMFFRNPLPYFMARPNIDIMVSGDCQKREDSTPLDRFPQIGSNIGVLYLRARPVVTRAVMNWLAWLVILARSNRPSLDQSTFNEAINWMSVDLGAKSLSVAMLLGEVFSYWCMGECGCDTTGLQFGERGRSERRGPDGMCPVAMVREWISFHVPCDGDMNQKARTMRELLAMYQRLVGPVHSLSSPMHTAT
ncbi:hypothetical protein HYH02_003188 [Chlamydomonas schloesseri]|uniref:Nucleotide-diphospho-sugar transferase domain-containing protein n=1 Tax=Chlamydomonas schloesseri TaxID=2026947 RepID=A0A835WR88_9CHLO|nr:hypothetical protein HYH02_003188 [Chlamydomonas schloesseri]|eukprot:KAG2452156.1 hypothetical protein HYH02_003188 [Chlamydomonas schloesseri]